MNTLHYIFDPLCGWCYAAAPLIRAARKIEGLPIILHAGGMMTGPGRRRITAEWRDYIQPHDRRIAQISGQPFGDGYFNGLLWDITAILDSEPPITAILAAETLGKRGTDLLERLQNAHYVEGLRISDLPVLIKMAAEIDLDVTSFEAAYARWCGLPTRKHIEESRLWLTQSGGAGFPTLVFAVDDIYTTINIASWLGRPEQWHDYLTKLVADNKVE
ncbi:DsbA family protein [Pectobacteriaceae bacterium C52]|nr:DsbA family protein [Pectobacteriaceae bacterium C52]